MGCTRQDPREPQCLQPSRGKHPGSGGESLLKGNRPINKSRHLKNETRGFGRGLFFFFFFLLSIFLNYYFFSQLKQTKLGWREAAGVPSAEGCARWRALGAGTAVAGGGKLPL